ncbi:nicotinamide-nucleotide amidohydrolase family protein [Mesotoga sp. BH458_6_3_2_1]|uniref:nicotinamide-nucleotide amidohydrolase family protein n=3 Tax=unclassified Mesotoga TaxID=1184398 RepID=UPI000EF26869|nr:nicotinamide-nucleotide amidohydrolase family protein [Mesotoga sp. BH458_6_3_2_1]NLT43999.1 nicotinamide-nucleotide amidohydrolase family protein [Thermotogaceae bacterium]RLL85612.1 damage-inducible protein CinA [Mesotoga sp. BH458_6_3_2_1]
MKAAILLTGDEITKGIVKDSNGGYLAERLTALGFEVQSIVVVPDSKEFIMREIRNALDRSDLLLITGGLGSTFDDITLQSVADYLGRELLYDGNYHSALVESFTRRFSREAPTGLKRQAFVIQDSVQLPNSSGSARGAFIRTESNEIVILPGPPMEMETVFKEALKHISLPSATFSRTIGFVDLTEPEVEDFTEQMLSKFTDVKFVTRVRYYSGPTVILTANDESALEELCNLFTDRWNKYIYTTSGEELVDVVVRELRDRKLTISIAESCSGGRLSALLTSVPGVSTLFPGGIVSYSNKVKSSLLNVSENTLRQYGAVSEEVAFEMAAGTEILFGTDVGLSVTGIAGPSGGSDFKPVGLVCSGIRIGSSIKTYTDRFKGNRETIQLRGANTVIKRLWRLLWNEYYIK